MHKWHHQSHILPRGYSSEAIGHKWKGKQLFLPFLILSYWCTMTFRVSSPRGDCLVIITFVSLGTGPLWPIAGDWRKKNGETWAQFLSENFWSTPSSVIQDELAAYCPLILFFIEAGIMQCRWANVCSSFIHILIQCPYASMHDPCCLMS